MPILKIMYVHFVLWMQQNVPWRKVKFLDEGQYWLHLMLLFVVTFRIRSFCIMSIIYTVSSSWSFLLILQSMLLNLKIFHYLHYTTVTVMVVVWVMRQHCSFLKYMMKETLNEWHFVCNLYYEVIEANQLNQGDCLVVDNAFIYAQQWIRCLTTAYAIITNSRCLLPFIFYLHTHLNWTHMWAHIFSYLKTFLHYHWGDTFSTF